MKLAGRDAACCTPARSHWRKSQRYKELYVDAVESEPGGVVRAARLVRG